MPTKPKKPVMTPKLPQASAQKHTIAMMNAKVTDRRNIARYSAKSNASPGVTRTQKTGSDIEKRGVESKNVNHATATNQTITGNESITPQTNMYHKGAATPLGCLWTSVDMAKKATANGGGGRHRPHRGLKVK